MKILHGIDLDIKSGEFIVFVGPSGCGKSTLLRCIAGLEEITSGDAEDRRRGGQRRAAVEARHRHGVPVLRALSAHDRLRQHGLRHEDRRARARPRSTSACRQAADILQLTKYLDRLPKALSGGQRQRVAIGRAIVRNPKVFLFDEPLSNLDAALRVATRIEIAKLKESMPNTTMIYVTHDQVEAMTLADRIVVLKDGRIEQVGTPMELYKHPGNLFVAQFIGSPAMNILPATIEKAGAQTVDRHVGGRKVDVPVATPADAAGTSDQLRRAPGGSCASPPATTCCSKAGSTTSSSSAKCSWSISTSAAPTCRWSSKLPGNADGQARRDAAARCRRPATCTSSTPRAIPSRQGPVAAQAA